MSLGTLRTRFAVLVGVLAGSCTPLTLLAAVAPKDQGDVRVAAGVPYGPDSRRQLDVYVPRGPAGNARPVVVFVYGGSWSSGTRAGYALVGRALVAQSFVAVVPDYRLVPAVRYKAFVQDGAAAVLWAAPTDAYGWDGRALVLMGHLGGAYIAVMLAVDERWLGRTPAAVRRLIGLAGPYDSVSFDVDARRAQRPAETQSVTWAGAGDLPALLVCGADDRHVRPHNCSVKT